MEEREWSDEVKDRLSWFEGVKEIEKKNWGGGSKSLTRVKRMMKLGVLSKQRIKWRVRSEQLMEKDQGSQERGGEPRRQSGYLKMTTDQ